MKFRNTWGVGSCIRTTIKRNYLIISSQFPGYCFLPIVLSSLTTSYTHSNQENINLDTSMIITTVVIVWSRKQLSEQKMCYFGPEWEPRNCHQLVTFKRVRILGDSEPHWKVLEHLNNISFWEYILCFTKTCISWNGHVWSTLHHLLSCILSPTDIYFIQRRAIASGTYFNIPHYFKRLPILITQFYEYYLTPIPVAARYKAWVRGRLLAGIAGSNPTRGMDAWHLCCLLSGRGLCGRLIARPEDSYRVRCFELSEILKPQ